MLDKLVKCEISWVCMHREIGCVSTCSVVVVNHITGHDWGVQTEGKLSKNTTNSIVYHLIEKTESKLQNCGDGQSQFGLWTRFRRGCAICG